MNFLSFFLFQIIITFSFEEPLNPIPEGNGLLNAKYNHSIEEKNLFFVFIHFRHGARTPIYLKRDNHTDMHGGKWSLYGELTNLGRKQHYELGSKNRERYSNYINEKYDPKEVQIYSSKFERCINSVQSQLLGFYSNITDINLNFLDFNGVNIGNKNKDSEYIKSIIPAVNLFEYNEDDKFRKKKYEKVFQNHFDCPYILRQFKKTWNEKNKEISNLVENFNEQYYQLLIEEFRDIKNRKINTVKGFHRFCDVYISVYYDRDNNHVLEKISKYGINITTIRDICKDYLFKYFVNVRNGGYVKNNAIISLSPIIRKIINWMGVRADLNNNFAPEYNKPKLVLYSGHDSTIFDLQIILNRVFNTNLEFPDFASTQVFELRRYNYIYYVELYYNDKLKMNITYDLFVKQLRKVLKDEKDLYNLCYIDKEELYLFYKKILLGIFIIILVIIIYFLIKVINKEKYATQNYNNVIQIAT